MPSEIGALYFLRLEYKIRPIERQIPSEGELKTRAEADLVQMLAEAFLTKGTHPDDLALARRLLTHDQCEAIIAGLVRDHLGARPSAAQDAAALRRSQKPAPVLNPVKEVKAAPALPVQAAQAAPQVQPIPAEEPRQESRSEARQGSGRRSRSEPSMRAFEPRKAGGRSGSGPGREMPRPQESEHSARPAMQAAVAPPQIAAPVLAPTEIEKAESTAVESAAPVVEAPIRADAAGSSLPLDMAVPAPAEAERLPEPEVLAPPSETPVPQAEAETELAAPLEAVPDTHREPADDEARAFAEAAPAEEAPKDMGAQARRPIASKAEAGSGFGDDPWQDGPPEGGFRSQDMRFRPHRAMDPSRAEGRSDYQGGRGRDRRGREAPGAMMDRGPGPYRQGRGPAMDHRAPPMGGPQQGRGPGSFVRHSDFVKWELPEEEGDDLPILGETPQRPVRKPMYPGDRRDEGAPAAAPPYIIPGPPDDSFVEIYVGVGRRDGARASDLQRILMERAGLDRSQVQRIRVRERNAFISIPREELGRAIHALNGTVVAGKPIVAELARERSAGFAEREPEGSEDD